MFGYVLLVILVTAGVTLAESFFFNSFCSWIVRDWSFF